MPRGDVKGPVSYTHLKEYPLSPMSNVVTLSSVAAKITTKIESVVTTVVSGELAVDRQKINELSRDVDTNTARIAETYTIGETDALLESQAMQSKSEILAQVSETYATGEQVDELTDADRQIREQLASLSVTVDGVSAQTQQRGGANLLKGTAASVSYTHLHDALLYAGRSRRKV